LCPMDGLGTIAIGTTDAAMAICFKSEMWKLANDVHSSTHSTLRYRLERTLNCSGDYNIFCVGMTLNQYRQYTAANQ
jgi:hypothetical protein